MHLIFRTETYHLNTFPIEARLTISEQISEAHKYVIQRPLKFCYQ